MTRTHVGIVGADHAGVQVAASLRQFGFNDGIYPINDETHPPYQRPSITKAYLKGSAGPDNLLFWSEKFYDEQGITLRQGCAVEINRQNQKLLLASGASLDHYHFVLATGARNRLLDLPNANLPDVRYLRTLDESEALHSVLPSESVR